MVAFFFHVTQIRNNTMTKTKFKISALTMILLASACNKTPADVPASQQDTSMSAPSDSDETQPLPADDQGQGDPTRTKAAPQMEAAPAADPAAPPPASPTQN
jgi:hypothetical protein